MSSFSQQARHAEAAQGRKAAFLILRNPADQPGAANNTPAYF